MPCDTFCISFRMRRETWKPLAPLIRWLLVEQARCLRLQSMLLHRIFLLVNLFARICRPCFPGQKRKRRSDSEPIDAILVCVDCSVMMFHVEHPVGKGSNVSRETMHADWVHPNSRSTRSVKGWGSSNQPWMLFGSLWNSCNFSYVEIAGNFISCIIDTYLFRHIYHG